ncbi:methyltransferase domain-containing protein [Paenibacillus residui]|uniref:Methyltransferase domain-containing protein n=1 Tax=Paenibacillus residui TaxID=629724 RepID=A0ABW3DBJ6_9BACL
MNKLNNSAKIAKTFETIFKCPHCSGSMKVTELKSMRCLNKHTFDFAKTGYLNLLTRPANSHYKKELFEARHKMIAESELYTPLHEAIVRCIQGHAAASASPLMVVDLGCGEGSHLQKILNERIHPAMTGFGLDISKEAINLASKRYENHIWLVSDLAKLPFRDDSFHVILNILSPSNYKEFKRVLVPDGLIIKVVPRPDYLLELRKAFFENNEKEHYKNDESAELFKKHFDLLNVTHISYVKNLNQEEMDHLTQMTPLAWSSDKMHMDMFKNQDSAQITIDLDILVGVNKKMI